MIALAYLWIPIGLIGLIDAFRHSELDWTYADRSRPFWVTLMFFLGPLGLLLYAVFVRIRFPRADAVSEGFRK